ncbi:anaerobic C4-dicarboxylate transporter DcuB [Natronobacillus azotifigens]|uniref:Anaerobic C4-dicarboxylate transporter n=1 Tax=Natronobacillus azotifigens TaxID=472978 RepID=A0A9J6RCT5_9BACI|nr:anaerobic C4-dicarboxylate transporter [Natronobacillus azotifigens]MCZ0703025.1 anaerobic C4-dicarboxylate transporter [Natronobacillus azotifigens]
MFWLQLVVIAILIYFGAKKGDVFIGLMGGVGVAIFVFIFKEQPAAPPIDVMLIILSVVLAASALQTAKGLDYLVFLAEKLLRTSPKYLTIVAPIVAWLFTFLAGTGHIVYSLLPVINELAINNNIRPERPISNSIISSQQAITCSPMSAATAAMIGFMLPLGVSFAEILMITIPATLIGVVLSAFITLKKGKELREDPEFQKRLENGLTLNRDTEKVEQKQTTKNQKKSVFIFLVGVIAVVLLGVFSQLRPSWEVDGEITVLSMPYTIEIIMLVCAAAIVIFCKPKIEEILNTSIFRAGSLAIICAFGLAWMSYTFIDAQREFIEGNVAGIVETIPWVFAIIVFVVAALITSQAATTLIMMPIGIGLGLHPAIIIGSWMAVNANYFIPVSAQVIAALSFDTAGTTKIGKYVLNHSFMIPGLLNTIFSIVIAIILGFIII